jgi:hypothetical protein
MRRSGPSTQVHPALDTEGLFPRLISLARLARGSGWSSLPARERTTLNRTETHDRFVSEE